MTAPCVINAGTIIEDFAAVTGWTQDSTLYAPALSHLSLTDGGHSVSVQPKIAAAIVTGYMEKTIALDASALSSCMVLDLWAGEDNAILFTNGARVTITLSSTADYSKNFSWQSGYLSSGWNRLMVGDTMWTNTGTDSWANTMIRLRIGITTYYSGQIATLVFDQLRGGVINTPVVIWQFDDCYASQYTEAFPYLEANNMQGTLFPIVDQMDTTGYLTTAQIKEMHAAGWYVGNHTNSHTNLRTLSDDGILDELETAQNWLQSNGLGNPGHITYPGSNHDARVVGIVKDAGYLTAAIAGTNAAQPIVNPYEIVVRQLAYTTSLATAKTYIDDAIDAGACVHILLHDILATADSSLEWTIDDFEDLVDYVATKVAAGLITPMTRDEWYAFATDDAADLALFTVAEARAFANAVLANTTDYATAAITDKADEILERFERRCGVRFVPASVTETLSGDGTSTLYLGQHNPVLERPRRPVVVSAVTVDGTALTATELLEVFCDCDGMMHRNGSYWPATEPHNVVVTYTVGWATVPYEIKRAALMVCVNEMPTNNWSDRATSVSDGVLNAQLLTEGVRGAVSSIPAVNDTLKTYDERGLGIA
jgi:peptidoglycan/xylan/chitin deacetylase (PgdA/CDA1 family)